MKSLEGVLVVSIEQAVAAPLCTARLVDAARSGCDQMNLLTSVLVSRATRTHELSLFFNATVRC